MRESTRRALNAYNHAFYGGPASAHFNATRSAPWSGWLRLLALAPTTPSTTALDVGCGNGRFGRLLLEHGLGAGRYLGVDLSEPLLQQARADLAGQHLVRADVVQHRLAALLQPGTCFDLVVAWAVLHHIPGSATREAFVADLAQRVAPGGHLALSFWLGKADLERRGRIHPVDGELAKDGDAGDALVPWGSAEAGHTRFVHFAAKEEQDRLWAHALSAGAGLVEVADFVGDRAAGDHNRYLIARAPAR